MEYRVTPTVDFNFEGSRRYVRRGSGDTVAGASGCDVKTVQPDNDIRRGVERGSEIYAGGSNSRRIETATLEVATEGKDVEPVRFCRVEGGVAPGM